MMRLSRRDIIATIAVAVPVVIYLLWLMDASWPGWGVRVTGIVALALGFVASATAVVPSFDQLLHGNRWYLAGTSLLGVVALVAGVMMLWTASSTWLAVLVVSMIAMWAIATVHHSLLARDARMGHAIVS